MEAGSGWGIWPSLVTEDPDVGFGCYVRGRLSTLPGGYLTMLHSSPLLSGNAMTGEGRERQGEEQDDSVLPKTSAYCSICFNKNASLL